MQFGHPCPKFPLKVWKIWKIFLQSRKKFQNLWMFSKFFSKCSWKCIILSFDFNECWKAIICISASFNLFIRLSVDRFLLHKIVLEKKASVLFSVSESCKVEKKTKKRWIPIDFGFYTHNYPQIPAWLFASWFQSTTVLMRRTFEQKTIIFFLS